MALFSNGLLPASFRGVPFGVKGTETTVGRRIAMHQYPGRDTPWAEDLGRAVRSYRFRGFLLTDDVVYLGGPIQLQRALLLAASEKSGSGLLTHPTLGALQVVCIRCSISEALDAGRYSEIDFEFAESGKKSFPSLLSSSSGLLSAANLMKVALVVDAVRVVAAVLSADGASANMAAPAAALTDDVETLAVDATSLSRLASQLPGPYGRYAAGGNSGVLGETHSSFTADTTVADLVAIASTARVAVTTAGSVLAEAIRTIDYSAAQPVANAVISLVQALVLACADPADAIRLLQQVIDDGAAQATNASGRAVAGMFQRAAAASLVSAVGDYQPTSAEDASSLLARLAVVLEGLAVQAADAADDESFKAIRAGRMAVVETLRRAAGELPHVSTFSFGAPLPALALSQRLYRDPSRADSLVTQVNPRSPLFLPSSFQAFAS